MLGIILASIAVCIALQKGFAPKIGSGQPGLIETSKALALTTESPAAGPTFEGCAYLWADQDAPDLSVKIDALIKTLDPNASARAGYFGEECLYNDGHSTFSTMETDFFISKPVEGSASEEILGNWIVEVMKIIIQFPREEIRGNYGFVEIQFIPAEAGDIILRISIQAYLNEARGKTGTELFRYFHPPSVTPAPT